MKKLPVLILLLAVLTLGSCASKGWSCTKRYCDASEKHSEHKSPGDDITTNA